MNKKNIFIVALVVVIIILAFLLFWKKPNDNSAQTQQQSNQQTPTPTPTPTEVPAPSPTPSGLDDIQAPVASEKFADNNWLLEIATLDGKTVDLDVNVPAALTLNFDKKNDKYSGFSGCNTFGGNYTASSSDKFSFGATVSTKKYCVESSALENKILSAMGKIQNFSIDVKGTLTLKSADGKTVLIYKKAI
jgi:heat shock protein HslJ